MPKSSSSPITFHDPRAKVRFLWAQATLTHGLQGWTCRHTPAWGQCAFLRDANGQLLPLLTWGSPSQGGFLGHPIWHCVYVHAYMYTHIFTRFSSSFPAVFFSKPCFSPIDLNLLSSPPLKCKVHENRDFCLRARILKFSLMLCP